MTQTLVIIHVIASVIDTVKRLKKHPEETEADFVLRAIEKAQGIVRIGTPTGFDPKTDSCDIFTIDEKTGDGVTVWAMDEKNEGRETK